MQSASPPSSVTVTFPSSTSTSQLPASVDLEAVARCQAGRLRRIDARLQALEELPRRLVGESRAMRLPSCGRGEPPGRLERCRAGPAGQQHGRANARHGRGGAASASRSRRSTESATAPSATAAIPPRPIDRPIASPEAMPIRLGRYSWLITIVTPNVPITQRRRGRARRRPRCRRRARRRGSAARSRRMLTTRTGRRPMRSAIGPATSVPSPPASSISESRWLPCASECPARPPRAARR